VGHEDKLNEDNTVNEYTNECNNNNINNNTGSSPGEIIGITQGAERSREVRLSSKTNSEAK
jgi:hypothetical protein